MKYPAGVSICVLLFLAVLVYQNALSNGFTYDDSVVIVENYYIKHPDRLPALFDERYFKFFGEESYRPLVSLTYFFDYYLWGLSARGFHLTNLLLHAVNSCLFFVFFSRLFRGARWVFFAALLFVVHPVMTEAVNAIGFREELLTTFFTFSGLALFLKASRMPDGAAAWLCLGFSVLAFAAGLLSKENMLIYPALLGLVYVQLADGKPEAPRRRELVFAAGLLLVLVIYGFIRFYWLSGKESGVILSDDLWLRLTTGISIIGYDLKLFLFPFPLSPDYTFPPSRGGELIRAGATFLILVGICRMVWKCKTLRFGWLWFLLALIPTLNIYPIANPLAERYLYLPSIGMYVVFAAGLGRYVGPDVFFALRSKYVTGLKIFILICFAALTYDRNSDWKNLDTLWEKAYRVAPRSHKVLNSLGMIYSGRGDYAAAIRALKESLKIDPSNSRAYSNLGLVYHKMGRNTQAVEILTRGLALAPANVYILINLGKIKIEMNRVDEGLKFLDRAIEAEPYYAEPYLVKGNLYARQGAYEKAFAAYRAAARNRPDYPEPLINMGALYGRLDRFEKAVDVLHRALLIDPADPTANVNLASAYYFLKNYGKAAMYAKIAAEAGADLPDILAPLVAR